MIVVTRRLVAFALAASMLVTLAGIAPQVSAAAASREHRAYVETPYFVGHHCRLATCRFFTSSYSTAIYYYDRRTCGQWKSLSKTYLNGFRRKWALLRVFPHRKLHPPC